MSPLESGHLLAHYRIERKIGEGGMGEVYRAVDLKLSRAVAIKLLPAWAAEDQEAKRRVLQEARLASSLNHPNIVTVHSVDDEAGLHFIVMEYIEGQTLLELLRRGPLELDRLLDLGEQVAEALGAAHDIGLIHRDIKPANIKLTARGQAKVLDFGLAKWVIPTLGEGSSEWGTASDPTVAGVIKGTVPYMSPEQTRAEPLDPRSDLFSLGSVLYECATGKLPFMGANAFAVIQQIASADPIPPSSIRPELPRELDRLLMRALAKDRTRRYGSASEMKEDLCTLRAGRRTLPAQTGTMVKAPASAPNNLPIHLTSFVGRQREVDQVKSMLTSSRLVTLSGSGGCGKTRLGIEVAEDLLSDYPHGVWFAELSALTDPTLVPQALASVLGLRESPGRALLSTIADHLATKSTLIVLDNCEHLAAACATLADQLLRACPNLRILATSREGLGVGGEILWQVPSLQAPASREGLPWEQIAECEAVVLFAERAAAVQPGFVLGERNTWPVAQICHRLDGIPLAIELAAARVKVLPVEAILERLEDRFQLLTGGSRTALRRHQTLRAAIDWSYDLLSEKEQKLLNRLGVFAAALTLNAGEAICSGEGISRGEVLDLLSNLADRSLVVPEEGVRATARYRLLESIRQYGRERLLETGELELLLDRHGLYYASLAQEAEPELQGGEQAEWFNRLEEAHDNLRFAIQRSVGSGNAERGLALVASLWRFWWVRGNWAEGRRHLREVLSIAGAAPPTAKRAEALRGAAVIARGQGAYGVAQDLLEEKLQIERELGDKRGTGNSLHELGNLANERGDLTAARSLYEESLVIHRELGDQRGVALAVHNLGVIAQSRKDYASAKVLYGESLAIQRDMGNRKLEASSLNGLGSVAFLVGDHESARTHQERALAIQRELGDMGGIAYSLRDLGAIAERRGDYSDARSLLQESLSTLRGLGDREGIAETLEVLVSLAAAQAQPERALRLAGAASALRQAIGAPLTESDQERLKDGLSSARVLIGEKASEQAFAEGAELTLEQATDYASR